MKKQLGIVGLLIVAIIWGSGFVVSDIALNSLSPLEILFFRFFIAAILLGSAAWKKIRMADRTVITASVILGIFLYFAFALQVIGLSDTTPSKNAFLTAVNVVIVPFIAFIVMKKRVDRYGIVGAVLALIGIGLLSLNGNFALNRGDFLTLLGAICFAFHIFLTSEFVKKYDFMVLAALQMAVAFVLSGIFILLFEDLSFHFEKSGLLSVLYLGVFSTAAAFFLQTVSQKYTNETKAAVVLSMESVFGTLFSVFFIGERLTVRMLLGCILILSGVILSETKLSFCKSSKIRLKKTRQNAKIY